MVPERRKDTNMLLNITLNIAVWGWVGWAIRTALDPRFAPPVEANLDN